jgi:hypothetical protein
MQPAMREANNISMTGRMIERLKSLLILRKTIICINIVRMIPPALC